MLYVALIYLVLLEGTIRYAAVQAEAERVAIVNARIRERLEELINESKHC
jgi:hypothetical protein